MSNPAKKLTCIYELSPEYVGTDSADPCSDVRWRHHGQDIWGIFSFSPLKW